MELAGIGARGVSWLESVDIRRVSELAALSEEAFLKIIDESGQGPAPTPYPRELRVWHRRALAE